jgi:hypothetical protein
MSRATRAPRIVPADAYLNRRQLSFAGLERLGAIRGTAGGLAVAVDPGVVPLVESGCSAAGMAFVVEALVLFDGEVVAVRPVPTDPSEPGVAP